MEDIGETKAGGIQPQLSVGTPVYVNWNNSVDVAPWKLEKYPHRHV